MLENTLERLETLVAELLQQNQALRDSHDQEQARQEREEASAHGDTPVGGDHWGCSTMRRMVPPQMSVKQRS